MSSNNLTPPEYTININTPPAENTRLSTRKRQHDQLLANQASMETTITELRNLVDEQQHKIRKLEKRTKENKHATERLDDNIADLYDRTEELSDYIADVQETQWNEEYESGEPESKRPRRTTANYGPNIYLDEDEQNDEPDEIVIELNQDETAEI